MERNTRFNTDKWVEIYEKTDFGNRYPSSYLVSVFHRIIKEKLPERQTGIHTLDFGCSFGANSKMLMDQGLDVYGIDISEKAIQYCILKQGFDSEKFLVGNILSEDCEWNRKYLDKFDFIVASEILYYFSPSDRERVLGLLYGFLKRDGILYANMPAYNYGYLNKKANTDHLDDEGMIKVESSGAASKPLYVKMVRNKEEMRRIFHMFEEIATLRTLIEIQGENEEFHFIGKKLSDR